MGLVLKELGNEMSVDELDHLFRDLDVNGDGSVSMDEFLSGMAKYQALSLFTQQKEGEKYYLNVLLTKIMHSLRNHYKNKL